MSIAIQFELHNAARNGTEGGEFRKQIADTESSGELPRQSSRCPRRGGCGDEGEAPNHEAEERRDSAGSGSREQRLQKLGTPAMWLVRLAISLVGSVVFYNFNTTAAAVASPHWAWDPLLSIAFAITSLQLQYPYAGLWRARVLSVNLVEPVKKPRSDDVFE